MSSKRIQEESDYRQILEELKQYIDSNDLEMASLLLSDQNEQNFLKYAKKQVDKKQYDQIVKIFKRITTNKSNSSNQICQLRAKIIEKQPQFVEFSSNQPNAKIISQEQPEQQQVSQGDEASPNKIKRKQKKKLISLVGYPFYGVIKQLLFAHGIFNPQEQLVKMLHTRIQIMYSQILSDDIINILQKNKKMTHFAVEQYLKELFPQQYHFLINFLSKCKTVDKKLKEQSSSDESAYYSSEQQNKQQQVKEKQQKQQKYTLIYCNEIQKNFFKALTKNMSQEFFKQYSLSRQVNFLYLGVNEFRKFICTNALFENITKKRIFEFLSFVGCRFFRKIILTILEKKFGDLRPLKQKQSISSDDIKSVSNDLISQLSQKVQKIKSEYKIETSENIGYEIFKKQFIVQDYETLLPNQIIQQAQHNIKNSGNIFQVMDFIWQQQPRYRKLWMNRALAEQAIQKQKPPKKKCINYYNFLKENMQLYKTINGPFLVWKKYFTGSEETSKKINQKQKDKQQKNQKNNYSLRNKRKKLESLVDQ